MKLPVYNLKREVGRRDRSLRRGVRRRGEGAPLLRGGQGAARLPARGHQGHQGALRRLRLEQEALPAEGHRPRPPGLDPRAAPLGRRHGPRARAEGLVVPPAAQGAPGRAQERALALREGGPAPRARHARARRDQDQARSRRRSARSRPTRRASSSTRRATTSSSRASGTSRTTSSCPPEGVNVYDLLRHDHLIVSKAAARALEARLSDGAVNIVEND